MAPGPREQPSLTSPAAFRSGGPTGLAVGRVRLHTYPASAKPPCGEAVEWPPRSAYDACPLGEAPIAAG